MRTVEYIDDQITRSNAKIKNLQEHIRQLILEREMVENGEDVPEEAVQGEEADAVDDSRELQDGEDATSPS